MVYLASGGLRTWHHGGTEVKTLHAIILATTVASSVLTSCAADDPNRRAKTGAAVGALAGAVVGHQIHDRNGRYVGAAIGALSGAAVGNYMDKQQRELEQRLESERNSHAIALTRVDEETLKLDLASEVSFAINKASIEPSFRSSLNTMAAIIGDYDKTAVHIIGHTDSTGTDSYNQQLSEQRAESVRNYFNQKGITTTRMRASGQGESRPVASNETSAGRSRNRRVEIYLKSIVEGRENDAFRTPTL